jgi:hypothetical protein
MAIVQDACNFKYIKTKQIIQARLVVRQLHELMHHLV